MIDRIKDWILSRLQRGCSHPGEMVVVDLLEGDVRCPRTEVRYCNRCGAVKVIYDRKTATTHWRLPDPNLWRG